MSGNAIRVAIGLPVYNAERYLTQALDSILGQTYGDFELILSDNASTDGTSAICRAYASRDARIRYYRNEKNLGAARNFNRVFELSSAEYFKWAPYDDLLAPEFLARSVETLDKHQEAVLCYSRARIVDEQGAFVVNYDPGPDTSSPTPHERFRSLILHPEYALQLLGLIRSSVLKTTSLHGSYPSSDEVLLAELAVRGAFHEIPERLYIYRRHSEQSTSEPQQRLRVLFFDTSLEGKIVLPKWMYLMAGLRAIARAPSGRYDRARCCGHMLRWALVPAHTRALGKDVLLGLNQAVRIPFTPRKTRPGKPADDAGAAQTS